MEYLKIFVGFIIFGTFVIFLLAWMNTTKNDIDQTVSFCTDQGGTYEKYDCGYLCDYHSCILKENGTYIRYEIAKVNGKHQLVLGGK